MTILCGASVIDPSLYIPELRTRRKPSVLQELVACGDRAGIVRDAPLLRETLCLRERMGTTALGKGVAVPHARSVVVKRPFVVVARSHRGVDWGAPVDLPVQLIVLALSPCESSSEAHLDLVSEIAGTLRLARPRQKLLDAASFDAVATVFAELVS